MQPFDGHWVDGNFRVIGVMIGVVLSEAVGFPVGPPNGSSTFHGPGGGEVVWVREVVWIAVVVRESGVNSTGVSDVHSVSIPNVTATVSMDDKVAVRWAVQGRGFSGCLVEREVLKNHGTLDGRQALKDLNR